MSEYKCYKCEYEWETIVDKPKSCPRCKTRLDYVFKEKIDNSKDETPVPEEQSKETLLEQRKKYLEE